MVKLENIMLITYILKNERSKMNMKGKNIKKIVVLALAMMLVASLFSACAKKDESKPKTTQEKQEQAETDKTEDKGKKENIKMVLNLFDFLDGADMLKALEDIQKDPKFDHIDFEVLEKQADYLNKMPILVASGEQQDIVAVFNPIEKAKYASAGTILALDDIIKSAGVSFDELYGNYVNEVKYEGETFLIPYQVTSWVMFYNKAIFDHQGIPYPDANKPITWTQYRELAKKLTYGEGENKKYGALHLTWPMFWYGEAIMELGGGTEFYNKEGLSNIENPAFSKALQRTYDMMHVDKSIPTHADTVISKRPPTAFMTGDYGLFLQGSWLLNWAADKETYPRDFEIGIAPLPVDDKATTRKSWGVVNGLAIPQTATNPEEALAVAVELTRLCSIYTASSQTAYQAVESNELFVGLSDVLGKEGMTSEAMKNGFANPETAFVVEKVTGKNPSEYGTVIDEEVEKYFVQEQDLDTTIKNIKTRGDKVIKGE